jgi:sugar phosphate isomerase/epimerase
MWTRRSFLQHSSLALAAMTCLQARAAQARAAQPRGPLGRPIGLQIYTVREAAAKDLPGTLKAIADIGYGEIELAGVPTQPVAEMRKLLADCGLAVPSMHSNMRDLQAGAEQRIEYAHALGMQYLVCSFPWTADSRFAANGSIAAGLTLDDWKWNAEQLNRVGELARKAGVRCGYHNHNMEFRSYDGVVAFDELLRQTDPALVTIELDIGWVVTAGHDPVAYLRKYADRISLLHVKDVRKDLRVTREKVEAQTTEVGSGKIDWKSLFAATSPEHIRHYFVEQENFERSPLEAVKISFEYLRKLGGK